MVMGIGSDIVQIPRIERLTEKFGRKFIERILSTEELAVYDKKHCRAFVARRFAGKEAIAKALGQGIGRPLKFSDITIANNALGKPEVKINWPEGKPQDFKIDVSLSDDYPVAIAFAVVSCYSVSV
jgi:holo-[acyl-carrier protein] synthase